MTVTTPLMAWNSRNTLGANINEQMIFETADTMVREGLLDCGYEYLVIDDCWQSKTRNVDGRLVPDPAPPRNEMRIRLRSLQVLEIRNVLLYRCNNLCAPLKATITNSPMLRALRSRTLTF